MGEYECWDCNEKFHLEEPPYDGREICDECRYEGFLEDAKNEEWFIWRFIRRRSIRFDIW